VLVILGHHRRRLLRTAVAVRRTSGWLSRQVTATLWDTSARDPLRGRDPSFGSYCPNRDATMAITGVVTVPRSPWCNTYVERGTGSIRRECLDPVVIFNEGHLRRVLSSYVNYSLSLLKTPSHTKAPLAFSHFWI
ncbi:MAG: hypothetical protein ACRDGM_06370, partial [bacterium]